MKCILRRPGPRGHVWSAKRERGEGELGRARVFIQVGRTEKRALSCITSWKWRAAPRRRSRRQLVRAPAWWSPSTPRRSCVRRCCCCSSCKLRAHLRSASLGNYTKPYDKNARPRVAICPGHRHSRNDQIEWLRTRDEK